MATFNIILFGLGRPLRRTRHMKGERRATASPRLDTKKKEECQDDGKKRNVSVETTVVAVYIPWQQLK